jgi:hypothetical protein
MCITKLSLQIGAGELIEHVCVLCVKVVQEQIKVAEAIEIR